MQAMFLHKTALQSSSVELTVSYMEIYKDEVYDLFVNRESVRYIPVGQHAYPLLNTCSRHPSFRSVKTMPGKYSLPT